MEAKSFFNLNWELQIPDLLGRIVLRCLERDPDRRYPDVASLRKDIERFRAGERVKAPGNGPWFYAKRAWRRHPRFWAGVIALGLVAAMALGYAVNSELSSAARAVQMSQTAALAERVRAAMHSARLSPLHDIGEDRERLGTQIAKLRNLPEPNDPELRREHFRALRDAHADLEQDDLAIGFARRLAESTGASNLDRLRYIEIAMDRFRDAVRPFQSLPRVSREDYSADARKRILEPALALADSLSLPPKLAARLAALDGELDTARELAESLPRANSDDTSVLQLRAEIAAAQSQVALDDGAIEQAVTLIDSAEKFLQSAISIHRSDASLMQNACALAARRAGILAAQAAIAPSNPVALSSYCGDAMHADPQAAGTVEVLAMAWLTIAAAHDVRGEYDAARAAYAQSSAAILPVLADPAARAESRLLFARAELGLGRRNLHVPESAEVHLDRCIVELQRLVQTTPAYLPGLISLGEAHRDRGRFFANYKRDVEPDYAEAERNLRRAVALNPDSVLAHEALSRTLLFRFYEARDDDHERAIGFAKAAIEAQERVLAKQPDRPDALFNQAANLGDLWTYMADRAEPTEISATLPTLLQALRLFERVRELAPQRPDTYEFEIGFRAQAGENLRIAGQPRIYLLKAVPLLIDAAAANDVRLNESYVAWALTELAQALAETGAAEASRVFDQARVSLDHTLAVADERHEAMRMSLSWATLRARWAMTRKETPVPWLAFGERLLREALATERGKGDNIIACDGAALLAQKAMHGTTAMRIDAAEEGLGLFRQCETLSARYFQRHRSTADQLQLQLVALRNSGE